MFKIKKYIALLSFVVLLFPTMVQLVHAFEKHDHINICSSKKEHHFHEVEKDCSTLHLQLTGYTYESFFEEPTLLVHLYGTLFDFWNGQLKFLSNKNRTSRAPPIVV